MVHFIAVPPRFFAYNRLQASQDAMSERIAIKRLSTVEIAPNKSHQHEFHAGRLRDQLGFPKSRSEGSLTIIYYGDKGEITENDEYTLYDSRRKKRSIRGPEYRLYYKSQTITSRARAGDLIVLLRRANDLVLVVVPEGSKLDRQLTAALGVPVIARGFSFADAPEINQRAARELLRLPGPGAGAPRPGFAELELYRRAVQDMKVPATHDMASAAHDLVASRAQRYLTPDEFLTMALELETELFHAIETAIGNQMLQKLASEGPLTFDAVMGFALPRFQARRSRRGESLEHHFQRLLDLESIPYTRKCRTEGRSVADFIIPGCAQYRDRSFPPERLRMVGCKSKVRERWAQWLKEADRIAEKFALTLDPDLAAKLVSELHPRIRFFLPSSVIEKSYSRNKARHQLGTVEQLLGELRAATARP